MSFCKIHFQSFYLYQKKIFLQQIQDLKKEMGRWRSVGEKNLNESINDN